jgi:hypothetical protein
MLRWPGRLSFVRNEVTLICPSIYFRLVGVANLDSTTACGLHRMMLDSKISDFRANEAMSARGLILDEKRTAAQTHDKKRRTLNKLAFFRKLRLSVRPISKETCFQ